MFRQTGSTSSITLTFARTAEHDNGGNRTIVTLRTTHRLAMRLTSAYVSCWDVKFAGRGGSALESPHSEPMLRVRQASTCPKERAICDPFLLGDAEILRQHQVHLLFPQLAVRCFSVEILTLGL